MNRDRPVPVIVLAALVVLAGCIQADGKAAQVATLPQGTRSVVEPTEALVDVGSVDGVVTDDEQRPIADATVSLLDLDVEVLTGMDGRFEFTNTPIGEHSIVAAKPGYEGQAKSVLVRSRIATEVHFALVPLAIVEPFVEIFPHRALHHVAVGIYPTWFTTLNGLNYLCEGCVWTVKAQRAPEFLMLEIDGRHTFQNPLQPDQEHFWIKRDTSSGNVILERNIVLPGNASLNQTLIGKTKVFWIQIMCEGYFHPCYEERRDTWTTLFHHYEELPENYTARPR